MHRHVYVGGRMYAAQLYRNPLQKDAFFNISITRTLNTR